MYFCKSNVSAVQGHPRSLNLAPIESAYAISYSVISILVLSCTISEILQLLCAPDPTPIPNFGDVPVTPDRPCRVSVSSDLKLFGHEIIFEVFRQGQTDR